ncbi:MAG: 1-(5-phosphoribosyl)-5-[(5-phosphoribosylamino)methylideneamino]imidazole-4-carboxamide isomerase [Pseudomonadota bacterium]
MTPELALPAFELWPAIDLKNGRCVRLKHGDFEAETVFNDNPADQASKFQAMGFDRLHIVDLDGAASGTAKNKSAVVDILSAFDGPKQLGGGIRNLESVAFWLEAGIDRVILGTAAVKEPAFVTEAAREFPGKIVVGVDASGLDVKVEGWLEGTGKSPVDVCRQFEESGVVAIVYTDITRDGAMTGVNVDGTAALADAISIPVIASGGVAGASDISALAARSGGIAGAIIGRALYDGRLIPEEAIDAAHRHGRSV